MLSSQVTNDDLKCKAVWQGPSWNNDGRLLPPMGDRKTLHVCVYLQAHEEILQIQLLSGVPFQKDFLAMLVWRQEDSGWDLDTILSRINI